MSTTNELCPIRYMVPGAGGCSNSAARRDMPKKLAITIAGAVSLGSYEAGVMYEVLNALSQHNTWAAANNLPDARIEIDVLTGASAGGMTAAMTALSLLFDGAAFAQPYDNPLYNAWVKEI